MPASALRLMTLVKSRSIDYLFHHGLRGADHSCKARRNSTRQAQGGPHMGKGDKRTFRGKLFKGSHGKTRPGRMGKKAAASTEPRAKPARGSHKC
jgi:ribosomal small subunit protein bTHX